MNIESLTQFFQWCTIIATALYIWMAVILIFAQDFVFNMHKRWFAMPRESFNVVIYGFLGFFKLTLIVFFLVPYLALLVL